MSEIKKDCAPHWWVFEAPSGKPTVHGVCKKCGAERDNVIWQPEYEKLRTTVVDRYYLRPEDR